MYKGKGKPVRFRMIERVVEEMREARRKYNPPGFFIDDETILARKKDLREFCALYKQEIGLPFRCMARADQADGDTLKALKDAGCVSVHFGIESGNEHIRRDILRRNMSDETIVNAFRMARETGLKTHSFNIIGLPNETLDDVMKTLGLNRLCQPNSLQVTILYPFIGAEIRKVYEENGWLKEGAGIGSVYGQCAISLPDLSDKDLLVLQKMFPIWYYFPKARFLHWLIKFVNTKIPGRLGLSLAYRLDKFMQGLIKRSRVYDDFKGLPN
jgi:radical SAM superfamily enzyme YgiQ (UPF0313 family)